MKFIEFNIFSDALCMGERTKAGVFRPCVKTIPYSQISGALRKKFSDPEIHATGYLLKSEGYNEVDYFTYSPRERTKGISKLPIKIEFLRNVQGKIYMVESENLMDLPNEFEIFMGALTFKGFGVCKLVKTSVVEGKKRAVGFLKTRIPCNKLKLFNTEPKDALKYGYLFEPTSAFTGKYVLSLFENSKVVGPECLVERRTNG